MPLPRRSHSSSRPLKVGSSCSPATRRVAWAESSVQVRPQSKGSSHSASVFSPGHGKSITNLIRVKTAKPKLDMRIAKHESQGEQELHWRLRWIRNIFSEDQGVKQSVDLDPAVSSMPGPKGQPTRDQLPQWVLMPSTKSKCSMAGTTPVAPADIPDDLEVINIATRIEPADSAGARVMCGELTKFRSCHGVTGGCAQG